MTDLGLNGGGAVSGAVRTESRSATIARQKLTVFERLHRKVSVRLAGQLFRRTRPARPSPDISCSTRQRPYTVCSDQVYRFNRFGYPG